MKKGWVGNETKNTMETIQLGKEFANFIELGDVIALLGDLGTGKTTFIKGLLKGLQYNRPVTSPTYTLINEYDAKYPIIHIDSYRELELSRWIKLGLNDYMDGNNIILIEWADRIKALLPKNTINIDFFHKGLNKRNIILQSL